MLTGDHFQSARQGWSKIAGATFTEGDLPALLLALWKKWQPGSLAAELARALLAEAESREPDPEPEALHLADIEHLPKTARIDGVLPLAIPVPSDARWPADELLDEAVRLKLGPPPAARERARDELALAYLALLHRRPWRSSHDLAIIPIVTCPQSATSRAGRTLMLLGKLPLGGTVTIFFSSLLADAHCAFPSAAAEHFDRLKLHRSTAGKLLLAAGKPRSSRPREKWTFRL